MARPNQVLLLLLADCEQQGPPAPLVGLCSPGLLSPSRGRGRSPSTKPNLPSSTSLFLCRANNCLLPKEAIHRGLLPPAWRGTWLCRWQSVTGGHRWLCQPGRPECKRPLSEQPPGNSSSPVPPGYRRIRPQLHGSQTLSSSV